MSRKFWILIAVVVVVILAAARVFDQHYARKFELERQREAELKPAKR